MPHLDEGTIHAWLDGALSAEESERLEAHATSCAACAAMVAEARGIVAASSRILLALDNVPREVIPIPTPSVKAKPVPGRHVPWARIAAAVAFVAVGGLALRIATGGSGDIGVANRAVEQEQQAASAPAPALPQGEPLVSGDRASDTTTATTGAGAAAPTPRPQALPAAPPVVPPATAAARRPAPTAARAGGAAGAGAAPRDQAELKSQATGADEARADAARRAPREQDAAARAAVAREEPSSAERLERFADTASERVTVQGRVTDAGTGAGIGNAQVVVQGSSLGALTNASGAFNLPIVPSGQQTLRVQRLGYEAQQREIEAPAGDTVLLDVAMRPVPAVLGEVTVAGNAALAKSAIEGLTLVSRTTELAEEGGREIETSVYDYRPPIQVMLRVSTPTAGRTSARQGAALIDAARPGDRQRRVEEQPRPAPATPTLGRHEPIVERAGIRTLRWVVPDGSEYTLSGAISERELRQLRTRIP